MTDISIDLARLNDLKSPELRSKWRENYATDPPPYLSRDLLIRAAAYHIQEEKLGSLDRNSKRRLRTLAKIFGPERGEVPPSPTISLKPGTKLVREWGEKTHCVIVLDDGFDFKGKRYRSLSQIARARALTSFSF